MRYAGTCENFQTIEELQRQRRKDLPE